MNYCSRGVENCKTCTKEKQDQWRENLKRYPAHQNSIWKDIKDFIRWEEVWVILTVFIFCIGAFGWIGFFIAAVFDNFCHLGGGVMANRFWEKKEEKPIVIRYKPGCSKGPCKFCAVIQQ